MRDAAHAPTRPRAAEAPNKARAPTGRKKTPRKPAAAAHTNSTGTYKGDARAAVINARRRRRRPPAARILRRRRRPWLHRRRRVPVLRFARRARARRRALLWQWPFFVPAQSAGAACTQQNRWRAPSAGLPAPFAPSPRRRTAQEGAKPRGGSMMVPCEILEATSIHSSEAPPQTLPTASKNDKDSDSVDEHGFSPGCISV